MAPTTQIRRSPNNVNQADLSSFRALPATEEPSEGPEVIRVELDGKLAGYHILLNADELTLGLADDLRRGLMLDALSLVIVGGDLPKGTDRDGLRRLNSGGMASVMKGVNSAFEIGKR